jgi:hypothetical protein
MNAPVRRNLTGAFGKISDFDFRLSRVRRNRLNECLSAASLAMTRWIEQSLLDWAHGRDMKVGDPYE